MRSRTLLLLLGLGGAPAFAAPPGGLSPHAQAHLPELLRREAGLLERLQAEDPKRHRALIALRASDRPAYLRALYRYARGGERPVEPPPELREAVDALRALRREHPDGFDGLSRKDATALKAQVRALAGEVMDLKQAHRRARIAQMRETLEELEAEVARRDAERDKLLDDFVTRWGLGPVDL